MQKVSLDNIGEFARKVLEYIPQTGERAAIVALRGELGAGKTTFTQALARELGVVDVVQSPTYVLMKSYELPKPDRNNTSTVSLFLQRFERLVHVDAYRLDAPEQFAALRPETFLDDPHALVVVEWPERLGDALPTPDLVLNFSSTDAGEGERYIEVV
ncbi:MAG: tRNA (adenosine(37)-N6)-threonylcarbamoyltransferase complex ATPase subunit type 1 TsaE [bacterium]|nr:tRNA (adenosine(37)-N6)-threonylcarbamoyltransferase complex ATPase subunit type 1 TsaE [bacterium]